MTDVLSDPVFNINFPYSLGEPQSAADFRSSPEDFIVEEILGFEPSGEGEHLLIHIRKRGENTSWIAEQLAKFFVIKVMDVGYCGMKDRHALTSQWFSLYLPKTLPEQDADKLSAFVEQTEAQMEVLAHCRHRKKLRRGEHEANRFVITLRNLTSESGLEQRLQAIADAGVPNYFGEQRFGRNAGNLLWADRWFRQGEVIRSRNKKVMAKSAARSYIFNCVLGRRVEEQTWNKALNDDADSTTGPLWGRGRAPVSETLAEQEALAMSEVESWLDGLEHVGLNQDRRGLVLKPIGFSWTLENAQLCLKFDLPPGAYATSILRELAVLDNKSNQPEAADSSTA